MNFAWHILIFFLMRLFVLDTDASQPLGIGTVLSRLQPNDTQRVKAYGSRSFN